MALHPLLLPLLPGPDALLPVLLPALLPLLLPVARQAARQRPLMPHVAKLELVLLVAAVAGQQQGAMRYQPAPPQCCFPGGDQLVPHLHPLPACYCRCCCCHRRYCLHPPHRQLLLLPLPLLPPLQLPHVPLRLPSLPPPLLPPLLLLPVLLLPLLPVLLLPHRLVAGPACEEEAGGVWVAAGSPSSAVGGPHS